MRLLVAPVLGLLVLAACTTAPDVIDTTSRQAAEATIGKLAVTELPRAAVGPATDCIMAAASTGEINYFARTALAGTSPATAALLRDIASRPEAARCLAAASGPAG